MPYDTFTANSSGNDGAEGKPPDDSEEVLKLALERFKLCADSEAEYRKLALEDLQFFAGDQWPSEIKAARKDDARPCLTINRLPQFVHQVSNEVRQNKPAPKVSPVNGDADQETAEIIQGILRHIERQSNADAIRSYAAFYQIINGRGFYRILTRFVDPYSFTGDQDIFLQRIKNPATVYIDPTALEADFSDAEWAFIIEDLTRAQFKAQYPRAKGASSEEFSSIGDGPPEWASKDKIRMAEYFTRTIVQEHVAVLQDGSVVPLDKVLPGSVVVAYRAVQVPRVRWRKITCYEVLEEKEWPGQFIPIVTVLGEEFNVDGKTELYGMVRNAKDPQRMLNYWESAKTETIALAPRAPFIAAEGQLENHESEWRTANVKNHAVLQYKPRSIGQDMVPPPQRQAYEPPIQAISMAQGGAIDNLKAATGIYDASLGNRSNETAGIAIRARQSQGEIANYHFADNLNLAIMYEARVLVDLIPRIYDRPGRVARIIGEDGVEKQVMVNAPHIRAGVQKYYNLQMGRYDVAVDVGPSYKTKREQNADSMMQFAQTAPGLLPRFADLLVQALDWPMSKEIADRIRPADIPGDGQEQAIPPQMQAQVQQLAQQNQFLQEQLQAAMQALSGKQLEIQSKERMQSEDLASKERIALLETQAGLIEKAADVGSADAAAMLNAEIQALTQRLRLLLGQQQMQQRAEEAQQRIQMQRDVAGWRVQQQREAAQQQQMQPQPQPPPQAGPPLM